MNAADAVLIALVLGATLTASWHKPTKKAIGGLISKDRKGRTTLVIWPATRKRKGSKKR